MNAVEAGRMVTGAPVVDTRTGVGAEWAGLVGEDRARIVVITSDHRGLVNRVREVPLTDVVFDYGAGDEDQGGECVVCGAPGGYPCCNRCRPVFEDGGTP